MNYEQFTDAVLKCIREKLANGDEAETQKFLKNNGKELTGLIIKRTGEQIVPVLYLEAYYQRYRMGISLEILTEELLERSKNNALAPDWDYPSIMDLKKVKDQIIFKLVNRKKNEALLKEIPYVPLFDLALIFQILVPGAEGEHCSVLIRNSHAELWNISTLMLYEYARENTPELCPPVFVPLHEFMQKNGEDVEESELYVLTNEKGLNGAAALLYPKMLRSLHEHLGGAYCLLPSSVHEFLVLPMKAQTDTDHLLEVVRSVNENEVGEEDYLSDHIYCFDGNNITKM